MNEKKSQILGKKKTTQQIRKKRANFFRFSKRFGFLRFFEVSKSFQGLFQRLSKGHPITKKGPNSKKSKYFQKIMRITYGSIKGRFKTHPMAPSKGTGHNSKFHVANYRFNTHIYVAESLLMPLGGGGCME